jgi:excisionase family DNA binding protein
MRKLKSISKDWHESPRPAGRVVPHMPAQYVGAEMLTVKEAAERMRKSIHGVYRLIKGKALWAQPDGARYLIPVPAIDDYYATQRTRGIRRRRSA